MAIVTIVGSGMMGSALAFPARENGHEVRIVGTHLDREIIDECKKSNKHPKFDREFPLLLHIDEILSNKQPVNIPWEKFTYIE